MQVPHTDPGWEELTEASMSHMCSLLGLNMEVLQVEQLTLPASSHKLQVRVQEVLEHLSTRADPVAAIQSA